MDRNMIFRGNGGIIVASLLTAGVFVTQTGHLAQFLAYFSMALWLVISTIMITEQDQSEKRAELVAILASADRQLLYAIPVMGLSAAFLAGLFVGITAIDLSGPISAVLIAIGKSMGAAWLALFIAYLSGFRRDRFQDI